VRGGAVAQESGYPVRGHPAAGAPGARGNAETVQVPPRAMNFESRGASSVFVP
jgi:hypothetical protein